MFSKKTNGWLLIALLFLASLRLTIGIGTGVNFAFDWLMEIVFGLQEPNNIAHFVINLCVYAICIIFFFYFTYKWFIKK